ncbi:hypothetical protein BKA93DRAFT_825589 [Sparassis latifolia]
MDLRQTLMTLAKNWDEGNLWCAMEDKCAIAIRAFLVKLQIGLDLMQVNQFMIYDRQRTFEVFFMEATDPGLFGEMKREM